MALDNIPTLGPGGFNGNLDKVLVHKNGGSEVACSLLTLTNSALNLSGVYLDTVNQRVGINNPNPTSTLDVSGTINGFTFFGSSGDRRIYTNSNYFFLVDNSGTTFQMQGGKFSTSQFDGTAKFNIRGTGSTSATTSLLVQNSSGTNALTVRDDLAVGVGGGLNDASGDGIRFTPSNNSSILFKAGGADRITLARENSDKLRITARNGFSTYIGEGISTDGSNAYEWKMEGILSTAVAFDTTRYIKVFINGVAYKLAVCV